MGLLVEPRMLWSTKNRVVVLDERWCYETVIGIIFQETPPP